MENSEIQMAVDEAIGVDSQAAPSTVVHIYIRRGSPCPRCDTGTMDYNGLLDLECAECGFSLVQGADCS